VYWKIRNVAIGQEWYRGKGEELGEEKNWEGRRTSRDATRREKAECPLFLFPNLRSL
jgi:hypothetical protein